MPDDRLPVQVLFGQLLVYLDQVSKVVLGIHGGQLCTRTYLLSRLG